MPRDLHALGDEQLAERARAGDARAFGVLWERHARAGRAAARQFSAIAEPDDLVAEAYLQILRAVQRGGGPHEAFRPYLYRTIRNIALRWRPGAQTQPLDDAFDLADDRPDPETAALQSTITVRAFRTLPERWQTVLWYTEVEGMQPAEAAPHLGLSANGAAALAYRAREGLKAAWLQAHVSDARVPETCRWASARMGDRARGALSARQRERFDTHVNDCTRCSILVEEVDELSGRLAGLVLPLVLGGTAGSALLADLLAGGTSAAAVGLSSSTDAASATPSAAGSSGAAASTSVATVVAAVTAAAVAAATIAAIVLASLPSTPASESVAEQPRPPAASPVPAPPPVPTEPDGELDEREDVREPAVEPRPDGTAPAPSRPAPAPPAPRPTTPVEPPVDQIALPPEVDELDLVDLLLLPIITGAAEPGATVLLLDAHGERLTETVADNAGRWSITAPDPQADATTIAVMQIDQAGNLSPVTTMGPITFQRPEISVPLDIEAQPGGTTIDVALAGSEGERVQVLVNGVATGNIHTLEQQPIVRVTAPLPDGTHVVGVRYIDPDTGRVGALRAVEFTIGSATATAGQVSAARP